MKAWLFAASAFFYGWWNIDYLPLLMASLLFNYIVGIKLIDRKDSALLTFGVAVNLALLGYFKYAGFLTANINGAFGTDIILQNIILPLGISFITFQKIAWLVDCKRGLVTSKPSPLNFGLFVTFFPQLIAGPIVHHKEIIPQFNKMGALRSANLAAGLCLFAFGLFKKVMIADSLSPYVDTLFSTAALRPLSVMEAWSAMLAYSFQIYFDFSGYSDMALGLAKMFGIRLPANFYSPYKSTSIIDFWRRWHMTLSRFLKDYLYIPLGGSKRGATRRYINLAATMVLGGLWHGAAWTFVIWGAMHGLYLVINHAWREMSPRSLPVFVAAPITFIAVSLAWVFFRAENVATASGIVRSLIGSDTTQTLRASFSAQDTSLYYMLILASAIIAFALPNTLEILKKSRPAYGLAYASKRSQRRLAFTPTLAWGLLCGCLCAITFMKVLYEPSNVFLYFQF